MGCFDPSVFCFIPLTEEIRWVRSIPWMLVLLDDSLAATFFSCVKSPGRSKTTVRAVNPKHF